MGAREASRTASRTAPMNTISDTNSRSLIIAVIGGGDPPRRAMELAEEVGGELARAGAVVACAQRVASKMSSGNVVCLLADGGWKYLSTELWTKDLYEIEKNLAGKIWW